MKHKLLLFGLLALTGCELMYDAEMVGYVVKEGNAILGYGYVEMKSDVQASNLQVFSTENNEVKLQLHNAMLSGQRIKVHYEIDVMPGCVSESQHVIDRVEVLQ